MSTSSRRKFDVAISEVDVILWARGTGEGCVCGVCLGRLRREANFKGQLTSRDHNSLWRFSETRG